MPIEIRELVIKATVHKPIRDVKKQYITSKEIAQIKRDILEKCKEEIYKQFEKRDSR